MGLYLGVSFMQVGIKLVLSTDSCPYYNIKKITFTQIEDIVKLLAAAFSQTMRKEIN